MGWNHQLVFFVAATSLAFWIGHWHFFAPPKISGLDRQNKGGFQVRSLRDSMGLFFRCELFVLRSVLGGSPHLVGIVSNRGDRFHPLRMGFRPFLGLNCLQIGVTKFTNHLFLIWDDPPSTGWIDVPAFKTPLLVAFFWHPAIRVDVFHRRQRDHQIHLSLPTHHRWGEFTEELYGDPDAIEMSNEKNPGWLGCIGDYTTLCYRVY